MIACKDVILGEKAFCLGQDNIIYVCKKCDEKSRQCSECLPIPKPQKQAAPFGNANAEPYGFDIMGMIKKKEFLFGVGVGFLLSMLLKR